MPGLCAAYAVTCIEGTDPPRGVLSRPAEAAASLRVGSFGVGTLGAGGWLLRPHDFCGVAPPEIRKLAGPDGAIGDAPHRAECLCPTRSLSPRANETLRFGRRAPLGSLPGLPAQPHTQCGGDSYVVYACAPKLLLPPPPPPFSTAGPMATSASTLAAARAAAFPLPFRAPAFLPKMNDAVDVFIATSDHYGHGLFAMVERALNQVPI